MKFYTVGHLFYAYAGGMLLGYAPVHDKRAIDDLRSLALAMKTN